jgi:hypothetical protein
VQPKLYLVVRKYTPSLVLVRQLLVRYILVQMKLTDYMVVDIAAIWVLMLIFSVVPHLKALHKHLLLLTLIMTFLVVGVVV